MGVSLGVYTGVYHGGYPRYIGGYTRVGIPRVYMVGIHPGICTPVYMVGIHPPGIYTSTPPWVHPVHPLLPGVPQFMSEHASVAGRGSPGLKSGETPG